MQSKARHGGDSARSINLEYYLRPSPGRADYWRKMAAPRFRVSTIIGLLHEFGPRSVVDLGCGGGEMLLEVRREFPSSLLCGIDIAEHQILANRELSPGIEWRLADLEGDDPFDEGMEGRFDAVMATEIIEHVSNPDAFLRNARRLSSPGGGVLIVSTQSGPVLETERRVGHRRHFTAGEMTALLSASGWEPVRVWNAGFPFHDLSKRLANLDPDRTMRSFSEKPYTGLQNSICLLLRWLFKLNSKSRGAQLFAVARNPG